MLSRRERSARAVELAEALLREARAQETPEELAQARWLARLMADPHGKQLTIALIDQAFRSRRPARIADQLAFLLDRYGRPRFMEWWEQIPRETFGPAIAIYGSLAGSPEQAALARNFLEFVTRSNRGGNGGPARYPYEYLLVVARKRGGYVPAAWIADSKGLSVGKVSRSLNARDVGKASCQIASLNCQFWEARSTASARLTSEFRHLGRGANFAHPLPTHGPNRRSSDAEVTR